MTDYQAEKRLVRGLHAELEAADPAGVPDILGKVTTDDYAWLGVHPFNERLGAEDVSRVFWQPLRAALRHLQRREDIFFAGTDDTDDSRWVLSMGHLMGLFDAPWLGIPPTRKIAMLRYVEFNCVEAGRVTRTAFHCDIIDLMRQAGVYPLPPQTGASFVYPGPKTQDGLLVERQDPAEGAKTLALVNTMVQHLVELNDEEDQRVPPSFLQRTWHDDMIWYGPAGIGASYTIPRYQEQHQYPFRENLADKAFHGHIARFAEGAYAAFFGWPNLSNRPTGGFLGLPATGVQADMRVVDVYRRAGDKLAENWIFIDLPHWLLQQGADILGRNKELFG